MAPVRNSARTNTKSCPGGKKAHEAVQRDIAKLEWPSEALPGCPDQELEHQPRDKGHKENWGIQSGEGRNLLPHRTVQQWSRLPQDAVQPPEMKGFETQLGKAQQDLSSSLTLHWAGGWTGELLRSLSNCALSVFMIVLNKKPRK